MDPFIGEIRALGFPFAPRGWALCNGALLPIAQNTALYSLLGTNFGGDGRSTFALPNLQGRAALGVGQAPGGSSYVLGEAAGNPTVTLLLNQLATHTHTLPMNTLTNAPANAPAPGVVLGAVGGSGHHSGGESWYVSAQTQATNPTAMNQMAVGIAGGNQPHNNMQPYLTVYYAIALQGIFPQRP